MRALIFGAATALTLIGQAPSGAVTVDARALAPGELIVLTVTTASEAGAVHVRAFDRDWPTFAVDPLTWRTFVGIDLDVEPGEYAASVRIDSSSGTERLKRPLAVESKTFRTRNLTVDNAFVNPPASVQARIEREAAELNRVYASGSPMPLWTAPLIRPVPHQANSAFGTRSVFNGERRSPHGGADFLSPAGTPIKAPSAGVVLLAGDLYYTGGTVVLDHGAGLISVFAHMSSVDSKTGDRVEAGTVLGKVGATGRVTGAHLHWTLRANGVRVDPLSLLDLLGKQ
ncbi:MAG TPA: M23 family metallopeptidase [Vicinamibacterales bacterium]|nr:M23 family metallopeptidase [Vicinamibacterales bacterium]